MTAFREQLEDQSRGFAIEDQGSDVAIVAFGGIRGGLVIPPFEFFNIVKDAPVTKVFIRDLEQCWYGRGVPGLGRNLREVADAVGTMAAEMRFRPVFFGVSAGGFAAAATAAIVGQGEAHVFSPQASLRRADRLRALDPRWTREVARLRRTQAPIEDVRPLLRDAAEVPVTVYVSDAHRADKRHADMLDELPNVTTRRYAHGSHQLVKDLRDSGELREIMRDSLGADLFPSQ